MQAAHTEATAFRAAQQLQADALPLHPSSQQATVKTKQRGWLVDGAISMCVISNVSAVYSSVAGIHIVACFGC